MDCQVDSPCNEAQDVLLTADSSEDRATFAIYYKLLVAGHKKYMNGSCITDRYNHLPKKKAPAVSSQL